jgi:DNA-binding PadR family transcriptional regulator
MTGTYEAAIAELRIQRGKIDQAIEALESLGGVTQPRAKSQKPKAKSQKPKAKSQKPKAKSLKASPAAPKPKTFARKTDSGGETCRNSVIGVLREGPKRAGAIIKALKGKFTDQNVYQNLSYMKAKGEVKKNREDATFELTID